MVMAPRPAAAGPTDRPARPGRLQPGEDNLYLVRWWQASRSAVESGNGVCSDLTGYAAVQTAV
ncbi:hypothetical protein Ae707Ps1_5982c [Pseudonocardia sp. Ae707_Ps1]|nr:hypothetical protein Ae707Ps1_5982c [Pseudonocardia sp. Ae707_Ps1]